MKIQKSMVAGVLLATLFLSACQTKEVTKESDVMLEQNTENTIAVEVDTQVTEESSEIAPEVLTVTISAAGDCALGRLQLHGYEGSFDAYYDAYGEEYFFENVRDVFEEDDFTIVNLECVLTEETTRVEKKFNMKGLPSYTGIMTSSSIEACSLANNHTFDYGDKSHQDTEDALTEAGIVFGFNDKLGLYTTEEGITIGVISVSGLSSVENAKNYITSGVESLREQEADLILVCVHWGEEMSHYPTEKQKDLGHYAIDAGADLVIGHHPHVLQGVEEYKGRMICYSLGNFCFGGNRNPAQKNTMIYQQTFTFVDGVLQGDLNGTMIPCTISSVNSTNDFKPTIATEEKALSIIEEVNGYSTPYGNACFDEEGRLYLKTE